MIAESNESLIFIIIEYKLETAAQGPKDTWKKFFKYFWRLYAFREYVIYQFVLAPTLELLKEDISEHVTNTTKQNDPNGSRPFIYIFFGLTLGLLRQVRGSKSVWALGKRMLNLDIMITVNLKSDLDCNWGRKWKGKSIETECGIWTFNSSQHMHEHKKKIHWHNYFWCLTQHSTYHVFCRSQQQKLFPRIQAKKFLCEINPLLH